MVLAILRFHPFHPCGRNVKFGKIFRIYQCIRGYAQTKGYYNTTSLKNKINTKTVLEQSVVLFYGLFYSGSAFVPGAGCCWFILFSTFVML